LERVDQVLWKIIRTFELEIYYQDENNPWKRILSATAFVVKSTFHTSLQSTPGQLMRGRDTIFNIQHIANWEIIKEGQQKIINLNNKKEKAKRVQHVYQVGDKVPLHRGTKKKYESSYNDPFVLMQVNDNGTVCLRVNAVEDTYNIRRIIPYHASPDPDHEGECNVETSEKGRK
jgi:hypothetical protein